MSEMKLQLEAAALKYFFDHAHPRSGLVRDQADNFEPASPNNRRSSIAATGFALAVMTNAATRGLVPLPVAHEYVLKTLRFSRDHIPRHRGWFHHFIDWQTGAPLEGSEFSTIDSALFIGGALFAAAQWPATQIDDIAQELYRDMDFATMRTDGGAQPNKNTLSMAFEPGKGYTPKQWDMYGEQQLLLILGLGHPTAPLPPECWLAYERLPPPNEFYSTSLMGLDEALFVHQYSACFVDFRGFRDAYQVDYAANGRAVSRFHRHLMKRSRASETLKAGYWGFSAGDAPANQYRVYTALEHAGTCGLGAALGSAMFMPEEVLADAEKWRNGPRQNQIWGQYGFVDSLDLNLNWFSRKVFGITLGPLFLSLANTATETSVWRSFMKIPEIKHGLAVAATARPTGVVL